MKKSWLIWTALVVPVWVVLILCTYWEPVIRDGWGHVQWHKSFPTTPSNVWTFAHDSYVHNNPRLGQVLTLLVYTPGPWHCIVTPIVELGLVWLLTALALGRRPSIKSTDDALVFATILALIAVAMPQLGPMLFYRPFTGNYLYGFAISVAFILPYRFHVEAPRERRWWWIPIMVVAGFATGLSNEHTAPTFAAVAGGVPLVLWWKRRERPALWMVAGVVGVLAGGLMLFYAPGQDIRYNGLSQSGGGMLGRIAERGFGANVKLVMTLPGYLWHCVFWVVAGVAAWWIARALRKPLPPTPPGESAPIPVRAISRPRLWSAIVAIAAAFAIVITLLFSPKQGPRLYFASSALVIAAIASLVVPLFLALRPAKIAAWVAAGACIAYFLWACISVYGEVGPEFFERFDAIENAPPHSVVTVTPYTRPKGRWFIGEDFGVDHLRFNLAFSRGLQGIVLDRPAEVNNEQPGGI